jgi:hypothetical protein
MIASNLLVLATEGVEGLSPDHIAADLAVPIAILIFGGAMFALLWSNFGARKGGLILGVAMFGFMGFIGVFWWFGAPGTPVATGPVTFPGQAGDVYQPKWYPFEGESQRSEFFGAEESFSIEDKGEFQTIPEFVGTTDSEDPMFTNLSGDLDGASSLMIAQYFPRNDAGGIDIGASFRTELQDAVAQVDVLALEGAEVIADENGEPQPPRLTSYIAEVLNDDAGEPLLYVTNDNGQRLAAAELGVYAEFSNADGSAAGRVLLTETEWFAFKDPGAIWLPSAVWTIVSFLLFGLCLALLDRIEQREKHEDVEVEEAMDVQVPIKQ